jgi:hypothetical protein
MSKYCEHLVQLIFSVQFVLSRAEDALQSCILAAAQMEHVVIAMAAAIEEDERIDHRTLPRPGGSNATGRPKYSESTWGKMMQRDIDKLRDSSSPEARLFRRRFRVPFGLFELILSWMVSWVAQTRKSEKDCTGRESIPLHLLLLGVLRMLGRGTCTDGIKELSDISETKMSTFFKDFCK